MVALHYRIAAQGRRGTRCGNTGICVRDRQSDVAPGKKAGYRITAVDSSEDMLFRAQEKTRKNALKVNYACEDMCRFRLNRPVCGAVCACDGVNYLLAEAELRCFFERTYANLRENGVFV